ncbi:MAG: sodium/solute symporter [Oscillospiraceae bacterium]|jgi:SSS family solute:Na+ symporter|nr:sodium/solute symporter [Oscillospiraceae bacterium]
MVAKIIIFVIYVVVMLGIGIYAHRHTKTVKDFVLGGRNVGSWLTAFAYGTSYFSAVVFIGYAGQFGWSYGVSSFWIGIGNAFLGSTLAWIILGKRTRNMTKKLDAKTMPEFFEKRYNSKGLKIFSAIIIFIFLIPYTASVYNGLSRLFNMAFDMDLYKQVIIGMAVLTAAYVVLGGYAATAINDFVQGIVMLAGIVLVVLFIINEKGGFSTAIDSLNLIPDSNGKTGTLGTLFGPDPINLIGVAILTSLGTWGLPQMVTKFYAIKDDRAVRQGTIISTVFAIVVAGGSYFMGGFSRLYATLTNEAGKTAVPLLNGKPQFDAIVPEMLKTALPNILIGLVVILVLSASMSTLSSLVLTSSSTMTIDLIKPAVKRNLGEKKEILIMRGLILVFLFISVIIAFNKNASISTLMSYSWGALSGAFLGPFMWGLFLKKISKTAVYASFTIAIVITLLHMLLVSLYPVESLVTALSSLKFNLASPVNAGAVTMVLSIIITPIISIFGKKAYYPEQI